LRGEEKDEFGTRRSLRRKCTPPRGTHERGERRASAVGVWSAAVILRAVKEPLRQAVDAQPGYELYFKVTGHLLGP
jgi:hypothetical protein